MLSNMLSNMPDITSIWNWFQSQSTADLGHWFAVGILAILFVRNWWLKRSRNYWKGLVKIQASREIAEVCGEQLKEINKNVERIVAKKLDEILSDDKISKLKEYRL